MFSSYVWKQNFFGMCLMLESIHSIYYLLLVNIPNLAMNIVIVKTSEG